MVVSLITASLAYAVGDAENRPGEEGTLN